jgi:predicted dithiol-disulfide oxidoreductase (DUF899 family)
MPPSAEIIEIQKKIAVLREELTQVRRAAPPEPVRDYAFASPNGDPVTLSSLFGDHRDLLVVHNMGKSCPYCTLWADGFIGFADHLANRSGFALSTPDEPAVLKAFSESRHWNFPVVSHAGTGFAQEMGFEPNPGKFWPGVSAFHKQDDGSIVRTASDHFGPGDDYCALWHLFDLFNDGPNGWEPKYTYA